MKSTDDRANDKADRHAEMMQKQREIVSVSSVAPMIDWTTADYLLQKSDGLKVRFNERTASFALEQSAAQTKQEGLKAVNHQTIGDEDNRKQSVNMQFWHSIKQVVFVIACAAIIIYTLMHFARG